MSISKAFSQPFNVLWRSALVKAPRIVPDEILRWTCPQGPHPIVVNVPSPRGKHLIPVYAFVPRSITPARQEPIPVVIDYHGGGFWMGSCQEQAPFCTKLANDLNAIVLSVDYRMAPIDKYPAAHEDADDVIRAILDSKTPGYAVLRKAIRDKVIKRWTDNNKASSSRSVQKTLQVPSVDHVDFDTTRLAFTGFSSGGNLALNMAIDVPESGIQKAWPCPIPMDYEHPFALCLYYPAIDLQQLPSERTRPPKLPASKGWWSELNDMLAPTYVPRERTKEYRASPGLAPIERCLHKGARIQLVLAEIDALTPQNDEWISNLSRADRSNDVVVDRYENQTHGWTQIPESWLNEEQQRTRLDAFEKTITFIRQTWAGDDLALLRTNTAASHLSADFERVRKRDMWRRTPRSSPKPSRESSPVRDGQDGLKPMLALRPKVSRGFSRLSFHRSVDDPQ